MPDYRESIVVRIACDPPVLLWGGVGPIELGPDAVIPEVETALGGGELINFPDFQQLVAGTAERLDFLLSGVSEQTVALAQEESTNVAGARVDIGRIDFGYDWQPLGPIEWEGVFEARSLSVSRPSTSGGMVTRSITLTIVSGDTTRSRAPNAYFTDADQRRRNAADNAAANTGVYSGGSTRRFGPK
ncbi:hypothetical protein [Sphingomonas koreensis]